MQKNNCFNADIIFTGSRYFKNKPLFREVFSLVDPIWLGRKFAVGCATGLDQMVRKAAENVGLQEGIDYKVYRANWTKYGKSAGPKRNREMLLDNPSAVVVAFPGNKGTRNCIQQAKELGMTVLKVQENE